MGGVLVIHPRIRDMPFHLLLLSLALPSLDDRRQRASRFHAEYLFALVGGGSNRGWAILVGLVCHLGLFGLRTGVGWRLDWRNWGNVAHPVRLNWQGLAWGNWPQGGDLEWLGAVAMAFSLGLLVV
jgi:hypothetical protein